MSHFVSKFLVYNEAALEKDFEQSGILSIIDLAGFDSSFTGKVMNQAANPLEQGTGDAAAAASQTKRKLSREEIMTYIDNDFYSLRNLTVTLE